MARKGVEGHAPPGWPQHLPGPGAPGWQDEAVTWLFDHGPADWRVGTGWRKHPAALAWAVREHLRAQLSAARTAWVDLPAEQPTPEQEQVLREALTGAGPQVAADVRSAELLYEALRGTRFIPRL